MGWYFSHKSKADLIQELIAPQVSERASITVITHSLHDDILWSVVELVAKLPDIHPNLVPGESIRYIRCDLLQGYDGEWGYKPLEESMHPYFYSCPLAYLDMAPEQSREWRDGVRAFHAR